MPSSPKISRDAILQGALALLEREGYEAVNIKHLAQELGCSTQPISWQFGSMENLRQALTDLAVETAVRFTTPSERSAMTAFARSGELFVEMALERPRLFHFVYMGGSGRSLGGLADMTHFGRQPSLIRAISEETGLSLSDADAFLSTMVLYVHGMASLIASGLVQEGREEAFQLLRRTGETYLIGLGVSPERAHTISFPAEADNV